MIKPYISSRTHAHTVAHICDIKKLFTLNTYGRAHTQRTVTHTQHTHNTVWLCSVLIVRKF